MSANTGFWCHVCCTDHRDGEGCPGELVATGLERHGWRVNVETPQGIEAYGILVAETGERWRARILTYPKILWLTPGGAGTIKFLGRTPQEAEWRAIEFVRAHCAERGYRIRERLDEVTIGKFDMEITPAGSEPPLFPESAASPDVMHTPEILLQAPEGGTARSPVVAVQTPEIVASTPEVTRVTQALRKIRFLPVQFGVVRATEKGSTGNLSETGIFVITESPLESGQWVNLMLAADEQEIPMKGHVRWSRKRHHVGRSPGMGVRIDFPPQSYVDYVRTLR